MRLRLYSAQLGLGFGLSLATAGRDKTEIIIRTCDQNCLHFVYIAIKKQGLQRPDVKANKVQVARDIMQD